MEAFGADTDWYLMHPAAVRTVRMPDNCTAAVLLSGRVRVLLRPAFEIAQGLEA